MTYCASCRKEIPRTDEHVVLEDSQAAKNYHFHQGGCADAAYRLVFSHRPGRRLRVIKAKTEEREA